MNHNPHTTKRALHPCQELSIDFLFAGLTSKSSNQQVNFEGINGKTAWVLIKDHFIGVKHGDTRMSKAAPALWLKQFSAQHNPPCKDKHVCMDQGGKPFDNLEVKNLFTKPGCAIHLTGADASNQNGPAEQGHRTIADTMRAFLTGADLLPKFWPHAFCHSLRM